ncbi:hypothetical protein FOA43_004745 [Brettanomyces nanus]|uniref:Ubiquitin-protein ligase E3A N-terminal zinc-binding domain-containing protein n=1 Tax=Eeniella nana TaxID=13502 RepID=A0A875S7K7_EENNA|nr:uncharacterized protein FOA43_004745 [Brettanomyces nanus]QPG77336.1 hypothetical protein FOA43_004745 [Brettanomyces nanus]
MPAISIVVDLVAELPKADSLTLRPTHIYDSFDNDQDWKWFLEARLTSAYTTLTQGDELIIKDVDSLGQIYRLNVTKVSPARTVCIVDTDINLDIEPLDIAMAKQMSDRQSQNGEFQVLPLNQSTLCESSQKLKCCIPQTLRSKKDLQLSIISNMDFAISSNRFSGPDSFTRCTLNSENELKLTSKDAEFNSDNIYVIPLGSEFAKAKFTVRIGQIGMLDSKQSHRSLDPDQMICPYCGSTIAKASKFMHENFCRRNNIRCEKGCGKVFLRKIPETHWHCCDTYGDTAESLSLHEEYFHKGPVNCPQCGTDSFANRQLLAYHRAVECSKTLHECQFCHLVVLRGEPTPESRLSGMSAHEFDCGSRTTECYKCGKVLRRRDMNSHSKLHDLDRISKPRPHICSNENCVRPIRSENQNAMGLCDVCFGPLFSTAYDPTHSKLRSRVERKYIIQIKTGCGHKLCQNQLCASSEVSGKVKLDKFADIIKLVKTQLVPEDITKCRNWSFCVDEAMYKKKSFTETLKEMPEVSEYDVAWICLAVSQVKLVDGDDTRNIDIIKAWLKEYGVQKSEYAN